MAALVLAGLLQPQESSAQSELASVAVSRGDRPTPGWPKGGGNLFNQNFSPLTQINEQNAAQLKGVWRVHLDGSAMGTKYSGEAQPVVADGVVYIVTGADDVFAVGVKTGQVAWKYKANLDDKISTVCCGWTSRGVALGDGKVYVGQLDGRLVALDQKSGQPVWSIQAERWQDGYTITAAPLYYDGMIIVGFAGGENGTRGRVKAYDAADGQLTLDFLHRPRSRRTRPRNLAAGQRRVEARRRQHLANSGRRSRPGPDLFHHRQSWPRLQWQHSSRQTISFRSR